MTTPPKYLYCNECLLLTPSLDETKHLALGSYFSADCCFAIFGGSHLISSHGYALLSLWTRIIKKITRTSFTNTCWGYLKANYFKDLQSGRTQKGQSWDTWILFTVTYQSKKLRGIVVVYCPTSAPQAYKTIMSMAEEQGFEPWKDLHPCWFSRPVHSTALPLFQSFSPVFKTSALNGSRNLCNKIAEE